MFLFFPSFLDLSRISYIYVSVIYAAKHLEHKQETSVHGPSFATQQKIWTQFDFKTYIQQLIFNFILKPTLCQLM